MNRVRRQEARAGAARRAAIAVGAAAALALGATGAHAALIEVAVTGIEQARGHVRVEICTRETFLKPACPYQGVAAAKTGATIVEVAGVPPGEYAAQVFHDDTDGGVVHQNLLGIPREKIGFSNDAPLHIRGPRFVDAAFFVGHKVERISLKLRRLFEAPR
jgi:uncharacterized protein (DUF2141 family)